MIKENIDKQGGVERKGCTKNAGRAKKTGTKKGIV